MVPRSGGDEGRIRIGAHGRRGRWIIEHEFDYTVRVSLFNERIDVRSTTGGHPALFAWRGHMYRVRRVIGTWHDPGARTARDTPVTLVRVAAESDHGESNIADITLDSATEKWTLRRVWT
ncbi:hypothetical protein CLV63_103290 [Murinocardiopsis flavida]|uniref:DUF6504 domain-containing protein n=1 Tax=Murinocardiopsis flavida TaxID=645275 RepID=A0A2P8DQR3_9ACTN|nr:hypothetical protein CLV63_103290 [Murinocardiopsis flavida]